MVDLLPLTGAHHVAPEHAAEVLVPPPDALSAAQRERIAAQPGSFLAALPPPLDPGPALDHALDRCARHLDLLLHTGRLVPTAGPCMLVLRLATPVGTTTAVVADVDVAAYLDGRVRPHEQARPERVAALARELERVGAVTTPVVAAHRPHPAVSVAVARHTAVRPDVATTVADGTEVALWVLTDATALDELAHAVRAAGTLVVADGHHRAAAVARAQAVGTVADGRVLTAVVPSDQLTVQAFHRRVDGLADPGRSLREVLDASRVATTPLEGAAPPPRPGQVAVVADGGWVLLDLAPLRAGAGGSPSGDEAGSASGDEPDSVTVARVLVEPLVAHDGAHVVAVPAARGLDALVRPGSVGIALRAPSLDALADANATAGGTMPPKTTYITPKPPAGLLLVPRSSWRPSWRSPSSPSPPPRDVPPDPDPAGTSR